MNCPLLRKRMSESRSIRTAVLAMAQDRFTPEEIAIGLQCELSEVRMILFADKRQREQVKRLSERYEWLQA